jgi:hypothetical protein
MVNCFYVDWNRAVASATAQLVTASSVKADPGSVSHAKLTKYFHPLHSFHLFKAQ